MSGGQKLGLTIAERLAVGEDARRMTPIPCPTVLCALWVSEDPDVIVPNEILIYPDGSVLAVHADGRDKGFATVATLESAYRISAGPGANLRRADLAGANLAGATVKHGGLVR